MKSVTISQDLCHIVAKAGRNNEQKWLPLWMHARDTAEVMKYLIREQRGKATKKKDAITLMLVKHFFGHMDIQKELHQLWDLIME